MRVYRDARFFFGPILKKGTRAVTRNNEKTWCGLRRTSTTNQKDTDSNIDNNATPVVLTLSAGPKRSSAEPEDTLKNTCVRICAHAGAHTHNTSARTHTHTHTHAHTHKCEHAHTVHTESLEYCNFKSGRQQFSLLSNLLTNCEFHALGNHQVTDDKLLCSFMCINPAI